MTAPSTRRRASAARPRLFLWLLGSVWCLGHALPVRGGVEEALKTLTAVGREGAGNDMATAAWQEIVQAGPATLPALLGTMGQGSVVADNWLRLSGNAIVSNALRGQQALPLAEVEAFLKETQHAASGRQLAFELLQQADRPRADRLEPKLIHDPVQELRRGAVQRLIEAAQSARPEAAPALYQQALQDVRDEDQTKVIAGALKERGVAVDLPRHFGFLMQWQVIGPFDNEENGGFTTAFPPEREIRLSESYEGKGQAAKWQPFTSTDEYGKIDLNKPLGLLKEVTGYATTTIDSPVERDAELRLGCKNAWKVWLNGELLFGRDEYHRGQQMDQYKMKCHLKKGANVVLVKCCQNEQKEQWTVEWEFQLRLCDSAGTALLSAAP